MDSVSESMTSTFLQPSFISQPDLPARVLAMQRLSGVDIDAKRRNLFDSLDEASVSHLPVPSSKETVAVYLRVKPKSSHEHEMAMTLCSDSIGTAEDKMVRIDSENQITFTAPPDSNAFRIGGAEKTKMTHTYTFNRIFPPHANQRDVFETMVLPRVQKFLDGENQLIFAYGSTGEQKYKAVLSKL
jgi:hypothetical protein